MFDLTRRVFLAASGSAALFPLPTLARSRKTLRWLELDGPAHAAVELRYRDVVKSVTLDARGRYRI